MKRIMVFTVALVLGAGSCLAADKSEKSLAEQAESALKKATAYFRSISTRGGYVGIYSADLKKRYGEAVYERARATEIWVQPPGTPTVGECFLRAWRVTGDKRYLTAATETARALVWGQRKIGGWDHRVDVGHLKKGAEKPVRKNGRCTFDDNITQGALSFLMSMDEAIDEEWLSQAVELALAFMMKSQFKNGAWPQWYPLIGGYHDYYTFNDNTINDCIRVMLKAHRIYRKEQYLRTAKRGGDFVVLSQLPAPQAGWAQQYSHDLKPAWARSFEPPGVCSAATVRNMRTLVDLYLYTKDGRYLKPIPNAIAWLEKAKIGDDLWARLYEVRTNKPVYGDRADGNKIHYDYSKISKKERTSYSWQGGYGVRAAVAHYNKVKSAGAERYLAERARSLTAAQRSARAGRLAPDVRKVIASLDARGRWLDNGMIQCRVFVRNVRTLCEYLAMRRDARKRDPK